MAAVERGIKNFGRFELQGPIAKVHILEQARIVVDIESIDLFGSDMRRNHDRFTLSHPSLDILTSGGSAGRAEDTRRCHVGALTARLSATSHESG